MGTLLDGSIIILSNPARRVSPMKYRAIFFLSSSMLFAVPEKRTKRKEALPFFRETASNGTNIKF
jgi:hypothetical protein